MLLVLLILRLALSAIFGVAAVTKFLDQKGAREAVKNFGVPPGFAPAMAVLLPAFELAIALGLLFSRSVWYSALAAVLLLTLFVIAIGYNLQQGRTHDCHCFGQLYSRPLGWPTLARNIVFALGAALVLWLHPAITDPGLFSALKSLVVWQWLVLAGLAAGSVAGLFYAQRRNAREAVNPPQRSKGLPVGTVAPGFELPDYEGGTTSLAALLNPGRPLMLVFVSPTCGPCVLFFQEIGRWQKALHAEITIAIISKGSIKDNFVNVARNGLHSIFLQEALEVAEAYASDVTPAAVVIGSEGKIASELAAGSEEITKLLHATLGYTPELSPSTHHVNEHPLLA